MASESRAGRVDGGEALIRGQVSAPVLYTGPLYSLYQWELQSDHCTVYRAGHGSELITNFAIM